MVLTSHTRTGLSPLLMISNVLIWVSAVIVMGILSYFISLNNTPGDHIIYEEVIVSPKNLLPVSKLERAGA